jgi:predicted acylesterase/phospholipase RssA
MASIRKCLNVEGPKVNVVVFDGGGVRGRFGLELCVQLAQAQEVPLSKVFGMAVGVSAGAMIATILALGLLDESKDAQVVCQKFYEFMPLMFNKRNGSYPFFATKYDGSGKRSSLRSVLGTRTFADVKTPLVICCSTPTGKPVYFRSWDEHTRDVLLVDALDASSAVPTIFPPVQIGENWYVDGGVCSNRPLIAALNQVVEFFDQVNVRFVSVGSTGTSPVPKFDVKKSQMMGVIGWVLHGLADVLLGIEDDTPEQLMRNLFADKFLRIDCRCDDIKLDDYTQESCKRLDHAAKHIWNLHREKILTFVEIKQ